MVRPQWGKKRIEEKRFLEQMSKLGPPASLFLAGPEILLRDVLLGELEQAVLGDRGKGQWNREVYLARETPLAELTGGLRTIGLFAETRLIIVHGAERYGRASQGDRSDLWDWMDRPSPGIHLVLMSEKPLWELERANQFLKGTLARADAVIRLEHPTFDRAVEMVRRAASRKHDLDLPVEAARRLVEAVGPNLLELAHELDRLALRCGPGARIEVETLTNWLRGGVVGGFHDLEQAVLSGRRRDALRYWDAVRRQLPPPAVTWMLGSRHLDARMQRSRWGGGSHPPRGFLSQILRECYRLESGVKRGMIPSNLQEIAFEAMVWDLCERRGGVARPTRNR